MSRGREELIELISLKKGKCKIECIDSLFSKEYLKKTFPIIKTQKDQASFFCTFLLETVSMSLEDLGLTEGCGV